MPTRAQASASDARRWAGGMSEAINILGRQAQGVPPKVERSVWPFLEIPLGAQDWGQF